MCELTHNFIAPSTVISQKRRLYIRSSIKFANQNHQLLNFSSIQNQKALIQLLPPKYTKPMSFVLAAKLNNIFSTKHHVKSMLSINKSPPHAEKFPQIPTRLYCNLSKFFNNRKSFPNICASCTPEKACIPVSTRCSPEGEKKLVDVSFQVGRSLADEYESVKMVNLPMLEYRPTISKCKLTSSFIKPRRRLQL